MSWKWICNAAGGGRAIALKATDSEVDDTVDGSFDVVLAVLVGRRVSLLREKQLRGLDVRSTTKHVGGAVVGVVVVVGGGVVRAIALKATDALVDDTVGDTVDDTVDGIVDVVVRAGLGLVVRSVAVKCKSNLLKLSNLASIR